MFQLFHMGASAPQVRNVSPGAEYTPGAITAWQHSPDLFSTHISTPGGTVKHFEILLLLGAHLPFTHSSLVRAHPDSQLKALPTYLWSHPTLDLTSSSSLVFFLFLSLVVITFSTKPVHIHLLSQLGIPCFSATAHFSALGREK